MAIVVPPGGLLAATPPMEMPSGTFAPIGAPAGIVKLIWKTAVESVGALPE